MMAKKTTPAQKQKKITPTKRNGLATRAIHAGEDRQRYADSVTTPIVQTST